MLFPESEDTDVIKYAGDLLKSIEIFLIWDQHPKSIWRLSMKRGNNCNESYSSRIAKTRCKAQIIARFVNQKSNW